jgi:hypothetical protein
MRDSQVFAVRLHRFEVWRSAVAAVAVAAIAASLAWAFATAASHAEHSIVVVASIAAALMAATIGAAVSLADVPAGVLSFRDDEWRFTADAGASRSGRLRVAIDCGSFLLLRLEQPAHRNVWLPVQRRGLEHEWHALRCAVYSPPRNAGGSPTATPSPPE